MKPAEIERLLPEVFRTSAGPGTVLGALISAMSQQHERSEQLLGQLDAYFDPRRTPDCFVPMLAGWVDLDRLLTRSAVESSQPIDGDALSSGTGPLRELVANAAYLSQWRGTRQGLVAFLETATGTRGFEIDEKVVGEGGESRPFHLRVTAPASLKAQQALIERIIEFEKPAYVTCDLVFNQDGT